MKNWLKKILNLGLPPAEELTQEALEEHSDSFPYYSRLVAALGKEEHAFQMEGLDLTLLHFQDEPAFRYSAWVSYDLQAESDAELLAKQAQFLFLVKGYDIDWANDLLPFLSRLKNETLRDGAIYDLDKALNGGLCKMQAFIILQVQMNKWEKWHAMQQQHYPTKPLWLLQPIYKEEIELLQLIGYKKIVELPEWEPENPERPNLGLKYAANIAQLKNQNLNT